MKKGKLIWLAVIAALVLVPTMSWAQAKPTATATEPSFMVELYLGGGAALNPGNPIKSISSPAIPAGVPFSATMPGDVDPFFQGGLKIGYWFTPYGTYAIAGMPDWMKYFGFFTDFSYHRLTFSNQTGNWTVGGFTGQFNADTSGNLATWAFMFAFRYGFYPDSVVPFGRLQPYIAVGPALFFSDQRPNITVQPFNFGTSPGGKDSMDVGIAVETGARYFINKAISIEASFKWRYFNPSYNWSGTVGAIGTTYNINGKADYNLMSGQLGVAYHF